MPNDKSRAVLGISGDCATVEECFGDLNFHAGMLEVCSKTFVTFYLLAKLEKKRRKDSNKTIRVHSKTHNGNQQAS
jgi:hypothetical protein